MSSNPRSLGSGSVSTLEVLRQLGFAEDQSQQQRGLSCDFGSFTHWALHCTNRGLVSVNNDKILGRRTSGRISNALLILTALLMGGAAAGLLLL